MYQSIRHGAGLMWAQAATGSDAGHFFWGSQGIISSRASNPLIQWCFAASDDKGLMCCDLSWSHPSEVHSCYVQQEGHC